MSTIRMQFKDKFSLGQSGMSWQARVCNESFLNSDAPTKGEQELMGVDCI